METITISIRRFEELLYKEAAYEMKRQELKQAGYASSVDKVLFQCAEEPTASHMVVHDDF